MAGNQPRTPQKRAHDAIKLAIELQTHLKHTQTLMEAASFSLTGENNILAYKSKAGAILDAVRSGVNQADVVRKEMAGCTNDLKRDITTLKKARDDALAKLSQANTKIKSYEEMVTQQLSSEFSKDAWKEIAGCADEVKQEITALKLARDEANSKIKSYEEMVTQQLSSEFSNDAWMEIAGCADEVKQEITALKLARDEALSDLTRANAKLSSYEQLLDLQLGGEFSEDEDSQADKKAKTEATNKEGEAHIDGAPTK